MRLIFQQGEAALRPYMRRVLIGLSISSASTQALAA
jgi:hypothetical protein